ncbi:MAG: aldo/keto reductase [Bacteroidota bacterium]
MRTVHIKGAEIPVIGMGTYTIKGPGAAELIAEALEMGYTYLDSAQMYGNESDISKGIKLAGAEREDVFVLTKVHPENTYPDKFLASVEDSLRNLGLDHVDLLLIHWPNPKVPVQHAIAELMKAQEKGYAKFIGVSNFNISMVQTALDMGAEIVTNQVEYHCFLNQDKLKNFLQQHGISLTAYSPLGQGMVIGNPVLKEIGDKYSKTEAQVALRWLIEQDQVLAIPRSSSKKRLASNLEVFDFWLSEEDKQAIDKLRFTNRRMVDWQYSPDWD